MADEHPETWRARFGENAGRRGVPLTTIVVATAVAIGFIDLNAALIVGLWVLRKIVLYVVIAFFLSLLFTPPMRFLKRRGFSHGLAATLIFLGGVIVLAGLVYLFASTSATRFPT
jgi:predicted PurR-regulated permease PerM